MADFGSAEGEDQFLYWEGVNKLSNEQKQRFLCNAFDGYEKNTTLMYRPPEMIDRYLKYDVDLACDIWMLGCILYVLCFVKHPFQD